MIFLLRRRVKELEWEVEELKFKLKKAENDFVDALAMTRRHLVGFLQGKNISVEAVLKGSAYETLKGENLKAYVEKNTNTLILDIRSDLEWENGHIPGAMHIPLNELEQKFGMLRGEMERNIAVICQSGFRSGQACELLSHNGFDNVINIEGGLNHYTGELTKRHVKPISIEHLPGDLDLLRKLASFLDTNVRPNLRRDGGDLVFYGIENDIVKINLTGACGGCGSKGATLNEGIRNAIMGKFPTIKNVVERKISDV